MCVWTEVVATCVCVCLDRSRCNMRVFGQKSLQQVCVRTELAATVLCFDRSRRNMSAFQHVVIVINYVCVNSTAATTTCPLHTKNCTNYSMSSFISVFFFFFFILFYSAAFFTLCMYFSNMHQYNHSCVASKHDQLAN